MKKNVLLLLIFILIFLVIIYFIRAKENNIETIAVVTYPKQETNIFLFFEQDSTLGIIEKGQHKLFIFAKESPSIFFIKEKIQNVYLENYLFVDSGLKKETYFSEMTINDASDTSYQVIGGSYRGILTKYYNNGKKPLHFITFRAGYAKDIKNSFIVPDSTVVRAYKIGLERLKNSVR